MNTALIKTREVKKFDQSMFTDSKKIETQNIKSSAYKDIWREHLHDGFYIFLINMKLTEKKKEFKFLFHQKSL